jgi:ATP-dependent RNA helicase SUPV3L1/SUV3
MLETEVSKTGEVMVEGHPVGRLHGFEFAPDTSGTGQDARALRAAAQKALAGEIEARAARLAAAGDEQFILSNDGVIRWIGEAVARLVPGDNVLEPRLRVLADEQLNGSPKEAVEARLNLWLKAHVEKLLGPLNVLARAEDVTGIARGIAYQVVEAMGVLERVKVAEEVKSLDQDTRAVLRKYGVRFGAYHIYLPALLKPAPRTLALGLWALKNGGLEEKGCVDLPALASSGRTSIPIDPQIPKNLYRLVGYRVCGSRAIRVDILERLADLIRPALAWRPHSPGEKPAGAFDGRGFTVTVGMTSLAGCSGEDFASILRSLGYRLDRRPPLPPAPPPPSIAADSAATAGPALEESPSASEPVVEENSDAAHAASRSETAAEAPLELGLGGIEPQATIEPAPSEPAPDFVDVWRPGRPESARRPPRKARPTRRAEAPAPAAEAAASQPAEPAREQRRARRPRKRADGDKDARPDRPRGPRNRPQHHRSRDDTPRTYQSREERPRDRPIDPNSPFAALMELKAKLEADRKDKD